MNATYKGGPPHLLKKKSMASEALDLGTNMNRNHYYLHVKLPYPDFLFALPMDTFYPSGYFYWTKIGY
jgi:hypothetical protein